MKPVGRLLMSLAALLLGACHPVHEVPILTLNQALRASPERRPECVSLTFAPALMRQERVETPSSVPLSTSYRLRTGASAMMVIPQELGQVFSAVTSAPACPVRLHVTGVQAKLDVGTTIYDQHKVHAQLGAMLIFTGAVAWAPLMAKGEGRAGMSGGEANDALFRGLGGIESSEGPYERQMGKAWARAVVAATRDLGQQMVARLPPPSAASPGGSPSDGPPAQMQAGGPVPAPGDGPVPYAPPVAYPSSYPPPYYPAPGWVPGPELPPPGYHLHDGFFLRVHGGPGYGLLKSSQRSPSGLAILDGLALGGRIADNLILYGEESALILSGGRRHTDSGAEEEDISIMIMVGAGVSYYFMPHNLFLSGSLQAAFLITSDDEPYGHLPPVSKGAALKLMLGKEWWVSDNWGLGISGHLLYAHTNDVEVGGRDWDILTLGASFVATYN